MEFRLRRIAREEAVADSLMKSIIDLNLLVQQQSRMAAKHNRVRFERKLKDSKLRLIATDSIIRKVQAGDVEIGQIKELLRGSKQEHKKTTRAFLRQLEELTPTVLPEPEPDIDMTNLSEEEKKILTWNKNKQTETQHKELRLLIDILFEKKIKHEHTEFLRKQYHKIKPQIKSPIINYNVYL